MLVTVGWFDFGRGDTALAWAGIVGLVGTCWIMPMLAYRRARGFVLVLVVQVIVVAFMLVNAGLAIHRDRADNAKCGSQHTCSQT